MITLSPRAIERVEQFIEKDPKRPSLFRVVVRGQDKDGFIYEYLLQRAEAQLPTDQIFQTGTFITIADEESYFYLKGSSIDWVDSVNGSGFKVENPNKLLTAVKEPSIVEVIDTTNHNARTNPYYR